MAVAWYSFVSQVTPMVVADTLWFRARVYVSALAEQAARMSIAVGVMEREVMFQAKVM